MVRADVAPHGLACRLAGGVALVVGLAGCAQLAGLDETSGDGRTGLSLAFERVSIGATVVRGPLDLMGERADFLAPDEIDPSGLARVEATLTGTDSWTADYFDGPLPVQFALPEFQPHARLWDYPNTTLLGSFEVLEHPSPTPAPVDAMFTVNVALDVAYQGVEGFQLFTVGSWNVRGLEPPALVGEATLAPPPFLMTSMTSFTGRPHEAITTDDAVLVLRYLGNDLTGVFEVPPFTQTGSDTIMGALAPVAHDRMLDVRIDQAAATARFTAVRPAVSAPSFGWDLRAAPGAAYNQNLGPVLHAVGVAPTDTMIQVAYGNPFDARGWKSTLTWASNANRTVTLPGQTLPVTLSAGMFQRVIDPAAALVLDLPAGLPELITLDGRPLSSDGGTVAAPTRAVEVTFLNGGSQTHTLYQLQLFELVPNAGGTALVQVIRLSASGTDPSFTLPPELLEPGKLYSLRAVTVLGGFPAIADGNFRERELPIAVSFLDSGAFQVTP